MKRLKSIALAGTLAVACMELLSGCVSNHSLYVIHDKVENDYWTGAEHKWGIRDNAKTMAQNEAVRVLHRMHREEEGGYANVGPEQDRPIVIEEAK